MTLFNDNTDFEVILELFKKCKFIYFSKKSPFKKFPLLDEEKQKNMIKELLSKEYDKKSCFIKVAIELGLITAEEHMHEILYKNKDSKPYFKKVLLGKIGHVRNVRGDKDNVYRKLWNQYCKIIAQNKYKPLIIEKIQDHRLWGLINQMEEDIDLEFKEKFDKQATLEVINSFLNSKKGGQLILGVSDLTRDVIGIEKEINIAKGEDGFRQKITNMAIDNFCVNHHLNFICKFHKIYNKTICRIVVQPSRKRVYFSPLKKEYYIRQNGRKQLIEAFSIKKIINKLISHKFVNKIHQ